jgi:hypothetical protein
MWDSIKEHERKHPLIPLRWQGYFSEAVEETIDEKLGSYVLSQGEAYVAMEWKNHHDVWKPDKLFKTLLPLIRLVKENKTPAFLCMDFAKKVVYDCRDDGSGDFQFRIDIKKQLSLARVISDIDFETRDTFSAHQRRTMFKGLLDNAGDEAGVKGELRVRTK